MIFLYYNKLLYPKNRFSTSINSKNIFTKTCLNMKIAVALDTLPTWSAMGPIVVALSSSDGATESNVTDKLIL